MEAVLDPGGGNQPHRHPSFSEAFEVLQGTLVVQLGESRHTIVAGQRAVAAPNTLHRFLNPMQEPAVFLTEVRPGSQSFEDGLRMLYGLAADGRTTAKGLPRNLLQLAVVLSKSEVVPPGVIGLLFPLLRILARSPAGKRTEIRLFNAYCRSGRSPGAVDTQPVP
ncbi:MAG TPA: cupin domain-containing protein [Thermoanaerobaculia bacterium]